MSQDTIPQEQPYRIQLSDIRRRPGMFSGSTDSQGLHHLIENVLALGLSESHEGRCTHITVTLAVDHSVTVGHDGHGLAGQEDPELGLVALEQALTEVEVNKALCRVRDWEALLCGVNALSNRLNIEIKFGGKIYQQSYRMGVPDGPAAALGPTAEQGLRLTFLPDPTIFEGEIQYEILEARLRELAFLHPGLHLALNDYRSGQIQRQQFHFKDGLIAFARFLHSPSLLDITDPIEVTGDYETGAVSAVLWFSQWFDHTVALYANDHATPNGGTGRDGLLSGTARVLNRIGRAGGLIPDKEDDICRHDAALGLNVILNVHLDAIEYRGSTKSRVGNPELALQVQWLVERQLSAYFAEHPGQARRVIEQCLEKRDHAAGALSGGGVNTRTSKMVNERH